MVSLLFCYVPAAIGDFRPVLPGRAMVTLGLSSAESGLAAIDDVGRVLDKYLENKQACIIAKSA